MRERARVALRVASVTLIVVFGLTAVLTTMVAISRSHLEYSEAGRYWDAEAGVVYDVSALEVFTALSIVSWLLCFGGVATYVWVRRFTPPKGPTDELPGPSATEGGSG